MIDRLGERERLVLIGGGALLAVLLVVFGSYWAYRDSLQRLDRTIALRSRQAGELELVRREATQLREKIQQAEGKLGQSGGFALATFVEEQTRLLAGGATLAYGRPQAPVMTGDLQEETFEMKLEKLSYDQVLRLLWMPETAPVPMRIRSVELKKRFDDPTRLDLSMTVSATRRGA